MLASHYADCYTHRLFPPSSLNCSSRVGGAGGEVESRKGGCEATLCLSLPRVIRARFSWVASRQPASTVHRNDEPSTSTSNDIRPMTLALGTNEGVTSSPSTRSLAVKWAAQQSCNTYRVCTARNGTRLMEVSDDKNVPWEFKIYGHSLWPGRLPSSRPRKKISLFQS